MSDALRRLLAHTLSDRLSDQIGFEQAAQAAGLNLQETQEAWRDWRDGGFAPLSDDVLSDVAGGSYPKGGLC
ncbi:hypothetical protein AALA99_05965 [Anaerotruncus colihominis]|uniref:Nif11 domain-containing protein n=1 Tax=Anaerotruncus colihominis TaxID=169435 RepID=A0A845RFZ2_9FIRM|nr:hypothetical protein [Anaerotruncus colihominis]NBI78287.1 hypothetical protein [Anaerotruncus colihominis]